MTVDMQSIISIVTGLIAIVAALLAVGAEKQKRVDLERRHIELAKESRQALAEAKTQQEKALDRVAVLERENTEMKTRHEETRDRLRDKASVESVDALRESLGRVEGTLLQVAQRLNEMATEVFRTRRRDEE